MYEMCNKNMRQHGQWNAPSEIIMSVIHWKTQQSVVLSFWRSWRKCWLLRMYSYFPQMCLSGFSWSYFALQSPSICKRMVPSWVFKPLCVLHRSSGAKYIYFPKKLLALHDSWPLAEWGHGRSTPESGTAIDQRRIQRAAAGEAAH